MNEPALRVHCLAKQSRHVLPSYVSARGGTPIAPPYNLPFSTSGVCKLGIGEISRAPKVKGALHCRIAVTPDPPKPSPLFRSAHLASGTAPCSQSWLQLVSKLPPGGGEARLPREPRGWNSHTSGRTDPKQFHDANIQLSLRRQPIGQGKEISGGLRHQPSWRDLLCLQGKMDRPAQ